MRNSRLQTWLPLAIYPLVAVAITWPLVTQITTGAIGAAYGDEYERIRLIWWTREAIQHGHNPFFQSLFAYPAGFFSAPQWAEPLSYWPPALIAFVTTPVIAYNAWTLIALVLNGWAAFFLCRAILFDPSERALSWKAWGGALIGGLIFLSYPTVQGQLSGGHTGVLTLYAFPLFALALWRILYRNGGIGTAIGGAFALVITALGNTDQMVFTLFPLTLFMLGYEAIFARIRFWRWRTIRLLVVMFGVGGLFLIPFFAPLAVQLISPVKTADFNLGGWVTYSTDPLSYIAPSPFTSWGQTIAPAYSRTVLGTNSIEGTAYLGLITLVLCVIALIGSRRHADSEQRPRLAIWLSVAIGSAIFALGPFLKWHDQPIVYHLGGFQSYLTLPWAIFQQLPILDVSRTPGRFNLATGLAISVVASVGMAILLTRLRWQWLRVAILAIAIVAILLDNQLFFPEPVTDSTVPLYLATLATDPNIRAVFDLPWDDPLAAKEALLFQTVHHKPLIAGYVVRQTPVEPAELTVLQSAILGTLDNAGAAGALLNQIGVDVVIVHLRYLNNPMATLQQITATLGTPIDQDARLAVFQVNPGTTILDPARLITTSPIADPAPASGVTIDSDVLPNAPPCRVIHLSVVGSQPATLLIDGSPVSRLDSNPDRLIGLPPGFHTLHVDQPIEAAPIDQVANDPPAVNGYAKAVTLGDGLALRCARIGATSGTVRVDLAWHAAGPTPTDDHLFVHLVGADGKIAAQDDRVPGSGTYPTTQWQPDQNWSESIDLPNIPAGTYTMQAGWYAYPSLKRIPVLANTPGASDGLIDLGTVTVP